MEISKKITEIRQRMGLSQEEMASRLFVTRQAVSRWENNETTPSIDTLKLISKEFNISLDELLDLPSKRVCQSCGMNLTKPENFGTNADEGVSLDYCTYCFSKGHFTHERTIDEMIECNLKFLNEYNAETNSSYTPEQARIELKQYLATLKRWK